MTNTTNAAGTAPDQGAAAGSVTAVTVEATDPGPAAAFYAALGLGDVVRVRASDAPTAGFRGFTLSLVVAGPGTVDHLVGAALAAGAEVLKPVQKSFWGYGGVVRAPDGTIIKVASSSKKKDTGPVTPRVDAVVLLLGVEDVKATRRSYVDRGLSVAKSFGSRYVEFAAQGAPVTLALYSRRAAAKDAGVDPAGSGSHRLVGHGPAGPFTDPDGFVWEA